jgi:hypothetical protein
MYAEADARPQDEIVIDSCRVARVVYRILANVEQTSDLAVGTIATTVVRWASLVGTSRSEQTEV